MIPTRLVRVGTKQWGKHPNDPISIFRTLLLKGGGFTGPGQASCSNSKSWECTLLFVSGNLMPDFGDVQGMASEFCVPVEE